jgi:hypothetical protein
MQFELYVQSVQILNFHDDYYILMVLILYVSRNRELGLSNC